MEIWDKLCVMLRARKVSVEDVSNKVGLSELVFVSLTLWCNFQSSEIDTWQMSSFFQPAILSTYCLACLNHGMCTGWNGVEGSACGRASDDMVWGLGI